MSTGRSSTSGPRRQRWAGRLRTISSSTTHSSRVGIWPSCGEVTTGGGRRRKHQRIFRQRTTPRRVRHQRTGADPARRPEHRTGHRGHPRAGTAAGAHATSQPSAVPAETISVSAGGPARTIGRTPDNDIVVNDVLASRHHAKLSVVGEGLVLEDPHSVNGTASSTAPASAGRYCARTMSSPSV